MKSIISLFYLTIFLFLSDFILSEKSNYCIKEDKPGSSDYCLNKISTNSTEECCYIEGKISEDYDYEKTCVQIPKEYSAKEESLYMFSGKLLKEGYWGDIIYEEISEITCPNAQYRITECEATLYPDDYSSCEGKSTLEGETCCFMTGIREGKEMYENFCIDVLNKDTNNLNELRARIMNGTYWDNYMRKYDRIVDLRCKPFSECESIDNPNQYRDCQGKKGESSSETCCFLYAKIEGETELDKECVDIKIDDTKSNDQIDKAAVKLTQGEYWDFYKFRYPVVKELTCEKAAHFKSQCERTTPDREEDCFEKKSDDNSTCCYLTGMNIGQQSEYQECVDIRKADLDDLPNVRWKIKNGTYWDKYHISYKSITQLSCFEVNYCKVNLILGLVLGLLLLAN